MSNKILHGQTSVIDDNGNVILLHQETSASDVLVDIRSNTQGAEGASAVPSDVDTLQKLTNKLGGMAFKSKVADTDLESEYLVVGETEDAEYVAPETEINDDITSMSLTWSSKKINDLFEDLKYETTDIFYIPLIEDINETYTTSTTVEEIEAAYEAGKTIWVIASEIFLPLRHRVDASTWIFSGYADGQAYDITITANKVTLTYTEVATVSDVRSIEQEIGTLPEDAEASNVIEYIDSKTAKLENNLDNVYTTYDAATNTVNFN